MCTRCTRDKALIKKFSSSNNMDPGKQPTCLKQLTQVEEMLTARACPLMCVYMKHGGQYGYKGHVVNLPQDIQSFVDRLPRDISEVPVILVRRKGTEITWKDFRVRRSKVLEALVWLKNHNQFYRNIVIDNDHLSDLPKDGIPSNLRYIEITSEETGVQAASHDFVTLPLRREAPCTSCTS